MYWRVNSHNLYLQNSLSSAPAGLKTLPKSLASLFLLSGILLGDGEGGGGGSEGCCYWHYLNTQNQSWWFIEVMCCCGVAVDSRGDLTRDVWTSSELRRKNISVFRIWLGFDNRCGEFQSIFSFLFCHFSMWLLGFCMIKSWFPDLLVENNITRIQNTPASTKLISRSYRLIAFICRLAVMWWNNSKDKPVKFT